MMKKPRFTRRLWHRDKKDLTKELESWLGKNKHNLTSSGLAECFLQERSDLFQGNTHDQRHVEWIQSILQETDEQPHVVASKDEEVVLNAETDKQSPVVLNYSPSDDPRIAAWNMAENLKNIFKFYTPDGDTSPCSVYQDQKGIWAPRGKELIAEIVTRSMSQFFKSRILSEVNNQIRNLTRNKDVKLGEMAPSRIVMANGVFDMDTCTFSSEFDPWDYQLVALPYEYNANADCPRFKLFLEEVCPDEDERLALVEFMGYCLVHHHKIHTFVVLVGNGENGKSKFCGALCLMLGEENVTGMTLQQLAHNRFMAARLVGKLANICPDIPDRPVKDTSTVKALTGEDKIAAEHKHQKGFDFVNYAKLLFSANQIPAVTDSTDAWFRRVRIIEFPNQFLISNEKRDENLGEKLAAEVQGIFNLAVDGWQRLKAQGKLTGAKSTEENRQDYLKRSNPLQYFAYQFCKPDPETTATVAAAYECYRRVAFKIGKVPITKNWFSLRLLDMLDYAEARQMKIEGKNTRIYVGLKIDLKLLSKELGNDKHGKPIIHYVTFENSILILKNAVFAVTDPDQTKIDSNSDSQPPLPDPSPDAKTRAALAAKFAKQKPAKTKDPDINKISLRLQLIWRRAGLESIDDPLLDKDMESLPKKDIEFLTAQIDKKHIVQEKVGQWILSETVRAALRGEIN